MGAHVDRDGYIHDVQCMAAVVVVVCVIATSEGTDVEGSYKVG